ncbi:MAG: helix-turn-helix domain-containing protein [Crocinitomicaceae bacterium]
MNKQTINQPFDPSIFTEKFINQTDYPVFLTGKAGTGKTTLLKKIIQTTHKQTIIVAPTGIAALNAGGVTIHSFFQLPFSSFIPDFINGNIGNESVNFESKSTLTKHFKMNATRKALIQNLELLIIDEVSMLRADLLDAIDWMLRNVRKSNEAFGGVQVLFIGDLLQLPPVVKQDEWQVLSKYYRGSFFFNAKVIEEKFPIFIELEKIYRQDDDSFISFLNDLRNNQLTNDHVLKLNQYVKNEGTFEQEGYVTLTTHNYKADNINQKELQKIEGKSYFFEAEITGEFPPHMYPIDANLEFKKDAQIMFIKNDIVSSDKQYYNGKMGVIKEISSNEIMVYFKEEDKTIEVSKYEWNNVKYVQNNESGEIEEEVVGTFVQYPIKLAWAITIHKSQGLTFEKAILDVSNVFAPGQAYVAFSRLKSLDGLILTESLRLNGMTNDETVVHFQQNKLNQSQLDIALKNTSKTYLYNLLKETFDWYDMQQAWIKHELEYKHATSKSEKGKLKSWIHHQNQMIATTMDPAKKFINQLTQIISRQEVDYLFLKERVDAAYNYFFKQFDSVYYAVLKQIYQLKKQKKTRQLVKELEELSDLLLKVILQLKRVKTYIESVSLGLEISKERIWNEEVKHYKITKAALIKQESRENVSFFDEPDIDLDDETEIIEKSKKEKKLSTYEQTLVMFENGKTVEEIAKLRQLTTNTIYNHLAKLIKDEKIELNQVLSEEKISELVTYFEGYQEESLTPLKEKLGDKVTWDELKLYRASQMR